MTRERFDGAGLRRLRYRRGLTVRSVARSIGVSPSTIYAYEQGRNKPEPHIYIALIQHLKLRSGALLIAEPHSSPKQVTS